MNPNLTAQALNSNSDLAELRLLHLADSALPIGALAHSFGIESLVSHGFLAVNDLQEFFRAYLEEAGVLESAFCRAAFQLVLGTQESFPGQHWLELNDRLGALKPARESRAGSAALGQNFLMAVLGVGEFPFLREALQAARKSGGVIHHSPAFGLASGALGLNEHSAILAYLHQSVASMVSACQRLMPLGQSLATRILWNLKPAIVDAAARSAAGTLDNACSFMPLLDWGAMEHPALSTRLFIS
jgi:urease accessory protein